MYKFLETTNAMHKARLAPESRTSTVTTLDENNHVLWLLPRASCNVAESYFLERLSTPVVREVTNPPLSLDYFPFILIDLALVGRQRDKR